MWVFMLFYRLGNLVKKMSLKYRKEPKLYGGEWIGRNVDLITEDDKKLTKSRRKTIGRRCVGIAQASHSQQKVAA